jgi:hypothetical protein
MTNRDRVVLIVISTFAVLAAGWLLLVSPERKRAASLKTQVDAASAQLASSSGELAKARADQARYAAAYASVVSLGKAVPAGQEVPSLIYQLAQASNQKNVDFSSITAGGSGAGGSAAASSTPASATSATASSGPATTAAGFTQMPFTFVFNGNFEELYHLFQQLNGYTVRTTSGGLRVSGRLLTIQSTKLTPLAASASAGVKPGELTGTITATAYVLPASQGLTGGATAASPAGSATTPVSSPTTASSPSAPAIVRVTP